jgi:hypothetical protein
MMRHLNRYLELSKPLEPRNRPEQVSLEAKRSALPLFNMARVALVWFAKALMVARLTALMKRTQTHTSEAPSRQSIVVLEMAEQC